MQIQKLKTTNLNLNPDEIGKIDFKLVFEKEVSDALSFIFKAISTDLKYFNFKNKIEVILFFYQNDSLSIQLDKFYPNYKFLDYIEFSFLLKDLKKIKSQKEANIFFSKKIDELVDSGDIILIKEVSIESVYAIFNQLNYLEEIFGIKNFFEKAKKYNFQHTRSSGQHNVANIDNYSLHYFFDGELRCTLKTHYLNIWISQTYLEITFNIGNRTLKIYNEDDLLITKQIIILMFKLSTKIECSSIEEILGLDNILSI